MSRNVAPVATAVAVYPVTADPPSDSGASQDTSIAVLRRTRHGDIPWRTRGTVRRAGVEQEIRRRDGSPLNQREYVRGGIRKYARSHFGGRCSWCIAKEHRNSHPRQMVPPLRSQACCNYHCPSTFQRSRRGHLLISSHHLRHRRSRLAKRTKYLSLVHKCQRRDHGLSTALRRLHG